MHGVLWYVWPGYPHERGQWHREDHASHETGTAGTCLGGRWRHWNRKKRQWSSIRPRPWPITSAGLIWRHWGYGKPGVLWSTVIYRMKTILHMVIEYAEEYDVCHAVLWGKRNFVILWGWSYPILNCRSRAEEYIAESQIEYTHPCGFLTKGERSWKPFGLSSLQECPLREDDFSERPLRYRFLLCR